MSAQGKRLRRCNMGYETSSHEFGGFWNNSAPFYAMYEMTHAALTPARAMADATRHYFSNPINPWAHTMMGRSMAAAAEVFERTTRRYGKPAFGIKSTKLDGKTVRVHKNVVWEKPFCRLLHFDKSGPARKELKQPKLLLVAPMSGHYATLLRGTVEAFLPTHDVYITDWLDARMVPLSEGHFDLDDYIDYVISMIEELDGDVHVMAVCQPSVPVMAAVSIMEAAGNPKAPKSMILMGGPIDTRISRTAVNTLAQEKGLDWFKANVITKVPMPYPGAMRDVYPGFLQLTGFMTMNLDRHVNAHRELYMHLVQGDGDSVAKHKDFYDEYLAVMDLTAEFYLQTIDTVFVKHALPTGTMCHRGTKVDPSAIKRVALMTVEGEKDDITGGGQTEAAHAICTGLAPHMKRHYLQKDVGHYGVFNGTRFRTEIAPRVKEFVAEHEEPRHRSGNNVVPLKPVKTRKKA